MTNPRIRRAQLADLAALQVLEQASFDTDRLSARSMKRHLKSQQNVFLVAEQAGDLLGYILVFLHRGTSLARLYSIAVSEAARGLGLGRALIEAAEAQTAQRGRVFMRLEVKRSNLGAINLYKSLGYRQFGIYFDYYEDHQDALRFQKQIVHYAGGVQAKGVPYYAQTTSFTCGPACLLMAMSALDERVERNQRQEMAIWREATTIYMTSGHGGCSPHGLALAAWRRGFAAKVYTNRDGPLFLDGVRSGEKKAILELVHDAFMDELAATEVELHTHNVTLTQLEQDVEQGGWPIVLISTYRLDRCKAPHWVVISAIDEHFVYVHNPDIEEKDGEVALDKQYLPIARDAFDKMFQFGQQKLRTAVVVSAR